MLTIGSVRDWFKNKYPEFIGGFYVGRLQNTNVEKKISFRGGVTPSPVIAIGGTTQNSYDAIAVNTIIHWMKDANQTDIKARELRDSLFSCNDVETIINEHQVIHLSIRNFVDIGVDEHGIQEYALDFEIIYQR